MRLKEINKVQRAKLKKQRHIGNQLNEQAIHMEVIMRKLRPDILKKTQQFRPDVRAAIERGDDPVKQILAEQGLLKEG